MTPPVFLASPGTLDDAVPSSFITLTGAEAHHGIAVQRLGLGERVDIVDGRGVRVLGTVAPSAPAPASHPGAESGGHRAAPVLTVAVEEVRREENEAAGIVLVQGLAKGGRDEAAVEAATGLGVERIVPWAAARSVVRWVGAKADRGRARWEAIARAETKVARRSWIPVVTPVATTADLVGAPQTPAVLAGAHIVVLHEDASTPFVAEVHRLLPLRRPLALVVGPEGGIGEEELAAFAGAGATAVRLGAAVLRSGAAGPAALAALAALRGAWS